jgi:uncharacterized protein (TIGR03435 family)
MPLLSMRAAGASLLWLIAICTTAVGVQPPAKTGPDVGDPAPLLKATTLLQAPADANLEAESLTGKVVILEFWATWCGPCVLAIPHMNALADKFKDQPVQFVAITSEDEHTVKSFLDRKPIKAWAALDADNAMKAAYGVDRIPHTVILASDGTVAAVTYPTSVTRQSIENLLARKSAPVKPSVGHRLERPAREPQGKRVAAPIFEMSVRPSESKGPRTSSSGGGSSQYSGYSVLKLLPEAFEGATSARVWTTAALPEGTYDVVVRQPRGHSPREAHELLWQTLRTTFELTATKTTNQMPVLVLRRQAPGPGLTPAATQASPYRSAMGKIEAVSAPLGWRAWTLEDKLDQPVIDETGLTNRYDITLNWEESAGGPASSGAWTLPPNRQGLIRAVEDQLGLELVPATRPVMGFVVSKAK